ncbi:MAG: hypothetical protein DSY43_06820 [Gammaproteobacteria bacterium]|nr:MAG: hypothetical protein DSY43_06820 [Gammaproteobacteria bacterium]
MPSRRPEPDWTPSVLTDQDSNSSQEESGGELNDSETLAIYNDAMEKLSAASGLSSDEFEPLTSRLTTTWKNTSKSMQDESKERALQGCRVVCEVVAPKAAKELFDSVCRPMQRDEDNDVSGELAALMTAYRDAPSRNVKIQILSLYAYRYPAEKLIKLHEPYETLTHWQIKQARKHAKAFGPGVVDSKPVQHRVRLSMPKVDHFIDFTNRPYFWQDVAFGTRILKLDSGQKVTMPNVIRTVTRSTMINQYYQYCEEEKFSPLSRATLFKILDVRGASQRKCLQGLDNIATDGAAGFETLEKIVDELGESGAKLSWCNNTKKQLDASRRYLKTEYQIHCAEGQSTCADHCQDYALSDNTDEAFRMHCEHAHNVLCDQCESLRCTLREIEDNINNFDLTFYSEEQKEDLNHDFNCARSNILDWKAHVLRASNQERAKQDFLHDMKAGEEALVVMDWAMKFNQLKFREKQSEWFGKRGLSWHISSVIMKSKETKEIEVRSFAHLFDSCTQDWYAVVSIVEDLLVKMKLENPYLTKVYIRSDEAGCYHNNNLIAALRDVSKRTRVTIGRLDHSEPQHGKDICDRILCPMKAAIRTFSNEGHDIVNARDMQTALDERPVKGTTAAVCSVNEAGKTIEVKKIEGFSKYHNFSFEKDGVRVWRCYGIGRGKLVPYKRLILKPQGPTGMIVEEPFFDMRQSRDFNLGNPKTDHDKRQPLFSCTQPGCTESFVKFSDLELHLDVGEHSPRSTSMYDKIRKDWANRCLTVHMDSSTAATCKETVDTSAEIAAEPKVSEGWALHKGRGGATQFSQAVKVYLTAKFNLGERTGRKCNPEQVVKDMRKARTVNNERMFTREEWLTKTQVQGFFSRMANTRKKSAAIGATDVVEEDDFGECLVDEQLEQLQLVMEEVGFSHPIVYDVYDICEYYQSNRLSTFNVNMLKEMCRFFEISFKAKDRKKDFIVKIEKLVKECSCSK